MDSGSLRTASTYLNNLLLARGLLRNGEPVDFVKPSKESRAQIINLVHDLILRQDRSREQHDHVADSLRHLRAQETRQAAEIERLTLKRDDDARKAAAAEAAERAATGERKKLERMLKSLQDQMSKLKMQLAQVRTQCANDVRKRDVELQRLKTHLQSHQRGNKAGMQAPSMTVVGSKGRLALNGSVRELADPQYSLKQETMEFMTQLSQSLSDENDGLISLIWTTLTTMHELLGLPQNQGRVDSAVGSHNSGSSDNLDGKPSIPLPSGSATSYEALAADVDGTLAHLKSVLTNPNFVPLSEVEEREEEIARLRQGWEHMERRWKDVLVMMESWREKMNTGHTIDLDDLRRGLGLVSPKRDDESHRASPLSDIDEEGGLLDSEGTSEIKVPDATEQSIVEDVAGFEPTPATSMARTGSSHKRKRDPCEPPIFFDLRPAISRSDGKSPSSKKARSPVRFGSVVQESPRENSDVNAGSAGDDTADDDADDDEGPAFTVHQKLDIAQQEAEEAATRRQKRQADQQGGNEDDDQARPGAVPPHAHLFSPIKSHKLQDGGPDELQGDEVCRPPPVFGVRRTNIRGRPQRRKSTLTREELDALILGAGGGDDDTF